MGKIILGDSLEILKTLEDNSVDSICTDPPAGINFMGKDFDKDRGGRDNWIAWLSAIMTEALRVTKPGGHCLVWALPRTSHWTATALENSGWEIREKLYHIFGCLSEDTEILTSKGWEPYHKCVAGNLALCYNVNTQQFGWEPIKEVLAYGYNDTAYRLHSDHTDQIVSRNHRCIVERSGREVFQYAETLQSKESVPILEDLPNLLKAVPLPYERTSDTEPILQAMQQAKYEQQNEGEVQNTPPYLSSMQQGIYPVQKYSSEQGYTLFPQVLRDSKGEQPGITRTIEEYSFIGAQGLDGEKPSFIFSEHERGEKSSMEGRRNLLQETRKLHQREICTLPGGISSNGKERRVCYGTSFDSSSSDRTPVIETGSSTPYRPQPNEQRYTQSTTLCKQQETQVTRTSRFTSTDLVNVTPIHYEGVVWCVRVPSGAFVARRNGKVFVTGNSGFPKSTDISKQIDKLAGMEREVVGMKPGANIRGSNAFAAGAINGSATIPVTKPATTDAQAWEGWGTSTKPAAEEWILCRKPISERNIALNVLKWGTGGLNIDQSRIRTTDVLNIGSGKLGYGSNLDGHNPGVQHSQGRWPSNFLLSHSLFCIPNGTKRVGNGKYKPPTARPRNNGLGLGSTAIRGGMSTAPDNYGDEEVESYICVPDCPIAELDRQSGNRKNGGPNYPGGDRNSMFGNTKVITPTQYSGDEGGASRYFQSFPGEDLAGLVPFTYCSKASRTERNQGCEGLPEKQGFDKNTSKQIAHINHNTGDVTYNEYKPSAMQNDHPTVKSLALCRYLIRLATPPGGVVLDCFAGSGSVACGAILEGFDYIAIEQDAHYVDIIKARTSYYEEQVRNVNAA